MYDSQGGLYVCHCMGPRSANPLSELQNYSPANSWKYTSGNSLVEIQ